MTKNETKRRERTIRGRMMSLVVMLFLAVGIANLSPTLIAHAENNAGDFDVTGDTTGYVYDSVANTLTFTASGAYTVTGNGEVTKEKIVISKANNKENDIDVTITLNNVNIDLSNNKEETAFSAKEQDTTGVQLTIVLQGENTLKSGLYRQGLGWTNNIGNDSTLTIKGEGSLTAVGGGEAAGIGGGNATNITISSGTVTAIGGYWGAGIGGGAKNYASNITISGGTVTAVGGRSATDIGGGWSSSGSGNITISGGSVKASKFSTTPTDGNGHNVYEFKVENASDINEIKVDDKTYTRAGNHSDEDGAFYLYMTGQNHIVRTQNTAYYTVWNSADSTFSTQPISPEPNVSGGTFSSNQSIILRTKTMGADIYYTTDGSTPSATKGMKYTGAIRLEGAAGKKVTRTIKAIAVKDGIESTVATFVYKINLPEKKLAKVSALKVKKSGKTFVISWKKVSGAKGYQVQFKKTGQKSWKNIKKVKKLSKTKWRTRSYIKGRTYQYRVRAYKVVGGKKVYGNWSKTVKIKK